MSPFKKLLMLSLVFGSVAQATEIKHRFLAKDESRPGLHYVDQFDSANDWDIKLERGSRDIRLLNGNRLLMSYPAGYLEYDLATQALLKKVTVLEGERIESVERLPNGHTILAGRKNGIAFFELDENDQLVRKVVYEKLEGLRLFRLSPEGNFLFTAYPDRVIEADWAGKIVADIPVPGASKMYWVKKLGCGKYRVATGTGKSIVDITTTGEVIRKLGGTDEYHSFARPFELENGNIVVSNWTGHKPESSQLGPQLIEFDPQGNVVWKWHDADRAGTIHGVIIMD